MREWLLRWKYRYIAWMGGADAMNRRVSVENYLWRAAAGEKPLPDAEKCRELARKLGIPTKLNGGQK